jgi:hypothetical protein
VGSNKDSKQTILTDKALTSFVSTSFHNNPMHFLANPEIRALKVEGGTLWTSESIKRAAGSFYVPSKTEVLIVWPNLFNQTVLLRDPRFRKKTTEDGCTGCMTMCPFCGSNASVRFGKFNLNNGTKFAALVSNQMVTNFSLFHPDTSANRWSAQDPIQQR